MTKDEEIFENFDEHLRFLRRSTALPTEIAAAEVIEFLMAKLDKNRMDYAKSRSENSALRTVCAEVGADMHNSIAHDGYRTVSTRCAPYTMAEEWESRLKQALDQQP